MRYFQHLQSALQKLHIKWPIKNNETQRSEQQHCSDSMSHITFAAFLQAINNWYLINLLYRKFINWMTYGERVETTHRLFMSI